MMTLNASHLAESKPSSSVARIKCPVEETGRNSVTPSTMPRIMAMIRIGMSAVGPGSVGGGQMNSPAGEPVARKEAQPLAGDRRQRGRLDAERFQSRMLARGNAAALEHQPLVAG